MNKIKVFLLLVLCICIITGCGADEEKAILDCNSFIIPIWLKK